MYNFHLPIVIDTFREYVLQEFSINSFSNEEFSQIEAFIKSQNGESFAMLPKPAMHDDSNQITYYCFETSGDYEDGDHATSEVLRFTKAMRAITDSIGRCGEEFFIVALGKCIRCFYDKKWHPLILKVLSNNHHKITVI